MDQSNFSFLRQLDSFDGDDSLLQTVPIVNQIGTSNSDNCDKPRTIVQKLIEDTCPMKKNEELPEKSIEFIDIDDEDDNDNEQEEEEAISFVGEEVEIKSSEQIVNQTSGDIFRTGESLFEDANETLEQVSNEVVVKDQDDDSDIEIIEEVKHTNKIDFKGDGNSVDDDLVLKNPFTSIKEFSSASTVAKAANSNTNNPNQSNILRDYFDGLNECSSFELSILNSQPTSSQQSTSNNNQSNEWIELDESDQEHEQSTSNSKKLPKNCQSTPMQISKQLSNLLGTSAANIKSIRIKKVVKKISTAAAASNARKPLLSLSKRKAQVPTKPQPNERIVSQNLFQKSTNEKPKTTSTASQPTTVSLQPKDALKQIVVKLADSVFELAKEEIRNLFVERFIDYEIESANMNEDYPCVVWKCRPELQSALNRMAMEDENSYSVTLDHNSIFDQLLIVIDSAFLHECVDQFLETIKSSDGQFNDDSNDANELLQFIIKCCNHHNIFNVTIVIYKLEQYLRSQRTRMNNSFRRKMNELIAEENGMENQPSKKKAKSKSKSKSNLCELTLEQVEMCLLDCKMRFFFGQHSGKSRFTFLNVENKDELAQTLFRYTRSLSEQIFRITKVRSSVDFFAQSDKFQTVDPTNEEACRLLWIKQLQQFPSLTSNTATQIASVYPSPAHLLSAFQHQASSNPTRLLTELGRTGRGISNELATKIYLFMTSTDPDRVLKT